MLEVVYEGDYFAVNYSPTKHCLLHYNPLSLSQCDFQYAFGWDFNLFTKLAMRVIFYELRDLLLDHGKINS